MQMLRHLIKVLLSLRIKREDAVICFEICVLFLNHTCRT